LRVVILLLALATASPALLPSNEEIIVPFATLEAVLLDSTLADKWATTDSLGRKGIYLIPDRNLSWSGFKRPKPDTLSLYSFYPEEIWWYGVRHWLEITELKEKNAELSISLQSRQAGRPVKPDYLLRLRFRREADSLVLMSKKLYPVD
jgi:hypothetical protein